MKKDYCLYIITNLKNDKKYIGITKNFEYRKKRHLWDLRGNRHHSIYLQRSFNKYGENCFEFSILFNDLTKEKAEWLEEFYLEDHYDNVYNVSKQSFGGDLISYHPELDRIKETHSKNGAEWWKNLSEEEKEAHREKSRGENNGMYGKKHSVEAKEKMSNAQKGRAVTDEFRKKMSKIQKARFSDPAERKKISEANRKRYENPEERRKTGEATKRVFAEKRARGDFDKPERTTVAKERRFDFVYEGVRYRGWKEATEATGLSMSTMRKRLLDEEYSDSYYITPPMFFSEEDRANRSKIRKGSSHSSETRAKMSESGLKRHSGDYRVIMPDGSIHQFTNRKHVHSFLIDNYDMRVSTINNLLKSGESWKPKKNIHKKLEGLRIIAKK